jgi:hypothetical protein
VKRPQGRSGCVALGGLLLDALDQQDHGCRATDSTARYRLDVRLMAATATSQRTATTTSQPAGRRARRAALGQGARPTARDVPGPKAWHARRGCRSHHQHAQRLGERRVACARCGQPALGAMLAARSGSARVGPVPPSHHACNVAISAGSAGPQASGARRAAVVTAPRRYPPSRPCLTVPGSAPVRPTHGRLQPAHRRVRGNPSVSCAKVVGTDSSARDAMSMTQRKRTSPCSMRA